MLTRLAETFGTLTITEHYSDYFKLSLAKDNSNNNATTTTIG